MGLPRNFYDAFVTTGQLARKRIGVHYPGLPFAWFPVIETPVALGRPIAAPDDWCWLEVHGTPMQVEKSAMDFQEAADENT